MINITITNEVIGSSHMYEQPGKQGKKKRIKAYRAIATDSVTGESYEFNLTRDSAQQVFEDEASEQRYSDNSECPPNKTDLPYQARFGELSSGSFCLRLHEPGVGESRHQLQGIGPVVRSTILIHIGPATSHGCFMVAGGKPKLKALEEWLRTHYKESEEILVTVVPR